VPYTVWSRARLIGETDLGFHRLVEEARSGWFHPSPDGERLLSLIASPLPAMRAYLHRDAVDAQGAPMVQPQLHSSTLFADLAEAFQHLVSLELELRGDDGSVVPTAHIGFQDTEGLIELARMEEDDDLADDGRWYPDDERLEASELDPGLEVDVEHDLEPIEQGLDAWDAERTWRPEDSPEVWPRYQIHVLLLDGAPSP
jgi:hypothetical protein